MKRSWAISSSGVAAGLIVLALACARQRNPAAGAPVVAYTNAQCFTGRVFAACRLFVSGQRFVAPVERPDSVIDLTGGWVVPPFGEAHNHNLEPSSRLDSTLAAYRRAGVLYVQNPNNLPGARGVLAQHRNAGNAPSVAFANGGLTGPGGHPAPIAAANISRGRWKPTDGEGAFYHTVSDIVSLDAAWRALRASEPDFVKVYLLYSDQYAARLADSTTIGWRGLDPALLPEVVRRAQAARLRVAAHVESAADFRTAIRAGVDMIVHLPGFRGDERTTLPDAAPFTITAADAREAARRRVTVVTTIAVLARYADESGDRALRQSADQLHKANLTLLRDASVRIAIGSDEYDDTSVGEARYLVELGAFTPAEVLHLWSVVTPQVIFPGRRIGELAPGFEASFLVLDGNPLADFAAVSRIQRIVFQGRTLAR